MSRFVRYGVVGLGLVGVVTGFLWPFLSRAGREGLILAGAIAFLVQVVAFGIGGWIRRRPEGFLVGLVGGMLGRLMVVGVVGVVSTTMEAARREALVLGVAGFLFALLLLEPLVMRGGVEGQEGINRSSGDIRSR